jgi:hypothetical protein
MNEEEERGGRDNERKGENVACWRGGNTVEAVPIEVFVVFLKPHPRQISR